MDDTQDGGEAKSKVGPFSGVLPEFPLIAVDYFGTRDNQVQAHFLTHFHADHFSNLSSRTRARVYASPVTVALARYHLGLPLSSMVELEVGQSHVISFDAVVRSKNKKTATVTLIDANHCPGSVMFLFRGHFGTVLHTGDFRYDENLHGRLGAFKVNKLYMDTTFCSPQFVFPTKQESIEQVLSVVRGHSTTARVYIAADSLAGADLILGVAKALGQKITVENEALRCRLQLALPEDGEWIVESPSQSRIRFCALRGDQTWKAACRVACGGEAEGSVVCIKASAMWANCGGNNPVRAGQKPVKNGWGVWNVLYASHSSFPELQQFVKVVAPRLLRPIQAALYGDIGHYFHKSLRSPITATRTDEVSNSDAPSSQSDVRLTKTSRPAGVLSTPERKRVVRKLSKQIDQYKRRKALGLDQNPTTKTDDLSCDFSDGSPSTHTEDHLRKSQTISISGESFVAQRSEHADEGDLEEDADTHSDGSLSYVARKLMARPTKRRVWG